MPTRPINTTVNQNEWQLRNRETGEVTSAGGYVSNNQVDPAMRSQIEGRGFEFIQPTNYRPVTPAPSLVTPTTPPAQNQTDDDLVSGALSEIFKKQYGSVLTPEQSAALAKKLYSNQGFDESGYRANVDPIRAEQEKYLADLKAQVETTRADLDNRRTEKLRLLEEEINAQKARDKEIVESTGRENTATEERLLGARGNLTTSVGATRITDINKQTQNALNAIESASRAKYELQKAQMEGADEATIKGLQANVQNLQNTAYESRISLETNLAQAKMTAEKEGKANEVKMITDALNSIVKDKVKNQYNDQLTKQVNDGYVYGIDELGQATRLKDADGNLLKSNQVTDKGDLITVGEGSTLYDPRTGKAVYTAPKTYKPAVGGGSSSPTGQFSSDLDAVIGNVLATIPSKFGQDTFSKQIARARNDADKIGTVAAVVLKNEAADTRKDFTQKKDAIKNVDKAIALLDKGLETGVINAGKQYVYNMFGKDYDKDLAAIGSYLTGAIQPYRNSITGAAWGDQEDQEYQTLFGSTKFSPEELKNRLQRVKEMMKDSTVGILNTYVNPVDTYANVFVPKKTGNDIISEVESLGYDYNAMRADGLTDAEIRDSLGL